MLTTTFFQECPPDSLDVYPLDNWDLSNCHSIEYVKNDPMISSTSFYLHSIYPNPFNPIARIPISMIDPDFIDISIYDFKGKAC